MISVETFNYSKLNLIKEIQAYREGIEFCLANNDNYNAKKLERKIKYSIDKFNCNWLYDFKE